MNEEINKNGAENSAGVGACKPRCMCPHHMTGPIIIVAVGVIMLLSVLGVLQGKGAGVALSVVVIIWGLMLVMKRSCRCCCGRK
jgi:uncharacterized membrane protein